ncbi:MAG: hypothetical protein KAW12_14975 [Candidatus Aminicenantes bacterium]|nr:hypothetical protein [Candidatus Aminicenantes bacterium]
MPQRRLTIDLPESADTLQRVLKMLLHYGLISKKKAETIKPKKTIGKSMKKSRWAAIAEEMSNENLLGDELGEELRTYLHEFREGFTFANDPGPKKT